MRDLPRVDAVHGQGAQPGRLRRLAGGPDRQGEARRPPPPPSGAAGQVQLDLAAKDVAFDKTSLEAPADQPFTIKFQNNDATISHNVAIHDAAGQEVFKGDIFPGVDVRTYPIPALKAGSYTFSCTVHPAMTGTLTVQ